MTNPTVLSSSTIIGDDVRNPAGEDLGSIKDLMIDLTTGTVRFAVVSFGGFLGMGNKLFAVPFEALLLDTDKKCFVLDTRGWLPVHPKSRIPPAILIPLQHHPRAQRRHPARW